MKVAFIGLGHMGAPISRNILATGHDLAVHDLRRDAAAALLAEGATWTGSPREARGRPGGGHHHAARAASVGQRGGGAGQRGGRADLPAGPGASRRHRSEMLPVKLPEDLTGSPLRLATQE